MEFVIHLIVSLIPFIIMGLIFTLIMGVIFVFLFFIAKKFVKERNETMEYCRKNGLTFEDTMMTSFPYECKDFKITKKGKERSFYFVVSGKRNNIDFSVMTYKYSDNVPPKESTFLGMKVISRSGSKYRKPDYYATLCVLSADNMKMPHFFIRDESFIMDSLGKMFGGQDINFEEDPDFSKKFVLQGDDEGKIRTFFNSKVRSSFVKFHQKGFVYEAVDKYLFIYNPNSFDKIEKKMQFLADSLKFLPVLMSSENENLN